MVGDWFRRVFARRTTPAPAPHRHDMPQIPSGNEDIIEGWRYCATLQLRTPLAVLENHGKVVPASPEGPPTLTDEMWHGIWLPELGREFDFLSSGASMASDVGPIPADGGDYLPFLKAVRRISEGGGTAAEMEASLRALVRDTGPHGTPYSRFAKAGELVDRVLPRTVHHLPVPANVRAGLLEARLDTLGKLAAADDKRLRAVKGLGPKALTSIRAFLATSAIDPDAKRLRADEFAPLDTSAQLASEH